MKKATIIAYAIALTVFAASPAPAQQSKDLKQLRRQIQLLQERQAEMQKELREIKSLLLTLQQSISPKAQEITFNVENLPFKGNKDARLTIVEFSDYQ